MVNQFNSVALLYIYTKLEIIARPWIELYSQKRGLIEQDIQRISLALRRACTYANLRLLICSKNLSFASWAFVSRLRVCSPNLRWPCKKNSPFLIFLVVFWVNVLISCWLAQEITPRPRRLSSRVRPACGGQIHALASRLGTAQHSNKREWTDQAQSWPWTKKKPKRATDCRGQFRRGFAKACLAGPGDFWP